MFDAESRTYFVFIIYLIVLFYDNIVALFDTFNVSITQIRTFNHIFIPLFTIYMLLKLKLTKMMYIIISIWFIGVIRYWLFTKGLIYNFIERSPQNIEFINSQMNYNASIGINLTMVIVEFYCLYFIFRS
jgi:hypothetical protein